MNLRSVEYDCGHERWFKPEFAPEPGEKIFCVKCGHDVMAGPVVDERGTYHPDAEWKAFKRGKLTIGVCARVDSECGFTHESWSFNIVRSRMELHYRRNCVEYGILREVDNPFLLPPNSPAPY